MNSATELPSHLIDHKDIFCCPICQGDFNINDESIKCDECNHEYKVKDGIPHLYIPNDWDSSKNDVTLSMKSFYENSPFPNYDDIDDLGTLINKSQKGVFARMLNEQIPFNIKVLEVGTGTGQLTNFLGIAQRYIFGVDMTLNSLSLAQKFKNKHNLNRVGFYQMNLFKPIFKENSFPLVICNGVLHHTSDPFRGFESISRLVEINGYIIIGLYHRYGRIITDIRRLMFRVSGNRFKWLDPNLRKLDVNKTKKLSWFNDQYKNPHESKHTIGEVLKWFKKTGFEFVYGIPNPVLSKNFNYNDRLFKSHQSGNNFDHFMVQMNMIFTGSSEGGFFILIGKKKE